MYSIVLPCRNEQESLGTVIDQIRKVMKGHKYEIIVSDSSTDQSPKIAKKKKTRLVKHDKVGYGVAYQEGIAKAKGDIIIMLDADGTYDVNDIPLMISLIDKGADFVIGDRFGKKMQRNSMPMLHKYIGNPVLSKILRSFFGVKVQDAHCGLRAIKKSAYQALGCKTKGMEFASEMVIKAAQKNLKIKQFPTRYKARKGETKLSSFSDGWRHLKLMLLLSPLHLYLIPGFTLFFVGIFSLLIFYLTNPVVFGITLYEHPMFLSAIAAIVGFQLIFFGLFTKSYYIHHFGNRDKLKKFYRFFTLEKALVAGGLLVLSSLGLLVNIIYSWRTSSGAFSQIELMIVVLVFFTLGIQTLFSSFMISLLEVE